MGARYVSAANEYRLPFRHRQTQIIPNHWIDRLWCMKRWSLGDFNPLEYINAARAESVCEPDRTLAEANQAHKLCGRGSALLDAPDHSMRYDCRRSATWKRVAVLMAECKWLCTQFAAVKLTIMRRL